MAMEVFSVGSPPCGYGCEKRNAAGPSVSRNISMRTGCAISPWPGNSSVMLYGVGYATHSVSAEKNVWGMEIPRCFQRSGVSMGIFLIPPVSRCMYASILPMKNAMEGRNTTSMYWK